MQSKNRSTRCTVDQGLESLTLDFDEQGCILTLQDRSGLHTLVAGNGIWRKGSTTFYPGQVRPVAGGRGLRPIAVSGTWTAADTYTLKLCYFTTPFIPTITCRFAGDQMQYAFRWNVSFGPLELPVLEGRQH